jgi:hypothetical protein
MSDHIRRLGTALIAVLVLAGCGASNPAGEGHPTLRLTRLTLSGAPIVGQKLTSSSSTTTTNPTSMAYRWQRCSSSCADIVGATLGTYLIQSADVGNRIDVVATASSADGSASRTSDPTDVIHSPPKHCDRSVTPSSFGSQVSAATPGQTICLATGDYGTWQGTNKQITITAASGQTPTMRVSFGPDASGFTLDGMSGMGGPVKAGATNITIQNSRFASQLDIEGAVRNVVINHNDFTYPLQSTPNGANSKIFLNTSGNSPGAAVTIENNDIENGDLDGVHFGGGSGDLVLGNTFKNLCDRNVNHTDNIQFEGGTQITIAGNYVYEAQNCPTQGITSYDGGTIGVIIEDNVVDVPRDWGIELYSDVNSIVRHNTVVWHPRSYSAFNSGDGHIEIDRKLQDPAGSGTHVYDNIATSVDFSSGSTGTEDHNVSGQSASYVGPLNTYDGFKLSSNSPVGVKAASDGLDDGARISTAP